MVYHFIYFIYKIGYYVSGFISLILIYFKKFTLILLNTLLLKPIKRILKFLIFIIRRSLTSIKFFASFIYGITKLVINFPVNLLRNIHRKLILIKNSVASKFHTPKKIIHLAYVKEGHELVSSNGRNSNPHRFMQTTRKTKYIIFTGIFIFAVISTVAFLNFLNTIPNPKSLADFSASSSTQIFDTNNTLLFNSYSERNRIPVSLSNVSPVLVKATVHSEDSRFYNHFGLDPIAIARSIFHNLTHNSTQGGSTITQQLAKNVFLSSEQSLRRKVEEAILAIRIEQTLSKDQILELYINAISYGGDVVGVEAASQRYFGKKAKNLSDKEAIYLASITSAPSIYGPSTDNNIRYKSKEQAILRKMVSKKEITEGEKRKIEQEKLTFNNTVIYKRAPHAVDYALGELPKYITNTKNVSGGFLVKTTIDLPLQNYIQQNLLSYITREQANNINNAGVIVIDPRDGSILALVGSANYFDEKSGQYNTVLAKRQLGSAVKLITYARALETTYTPSSTIIDKPTRFADFPGYNPRNYDGKFHGAVSLKSAFANSYNIPALKLANSLGLRNVADQAVAMGIPEFEFKDGSIPLSFAIGGVELPLAHLANAYSVVAAGGKSVNVHIIDSVSDYEENIVYKSKPEAAKQIISSQTANSIFKILSDNNARRPAFGYSTDFDFGANQVAIKTGTSNDNKDNVAMAFTKDFVVGVWVGNNNGESMNNIASGHVGATNIMHTVVVKMLDNTASTKDDDSTYALENKQEGR